MSEGRRARILGAVDSALSSLLRYDLSRTDLGKWVLFARQVLAILLLSVVTIAGLSAFLSTRQAKDLLQESLLNEAKAIAASVARAAFVPLTLEDEASLGRLVASFRPVERLGSLRILDAHGAVRASLPPPAESWTLTFVRMPIVPVAGFDVEGAASTAPIGEVEVGMRRGWIDRKGSQIALTNVAVAGSLVVMIWFVGLMVIRRLIDRMRDVIGEARLVEEVKRANSELESFSYSVAHDLRAPLRAVAGFSQALLDSYADKLDERGRHSLARIQENTRLMGQLITDLLGLSRVTRGELNRTAFDLTEPAREIAAALRRSEPERDVEFVFPSSLPVTADPGLMRTALENLLGNSWKYTAKRPRARIELGGTVRDGRDAYFVRDDGAGFDMAYSNKLFKPFSRLHSPGEFEGTGIGLATVQRIVERHGGRIWGEGAVDKGATFYFTLESHS